MTGGGRGEDGGVADARLEVEEAGGGADAAVQGVGLLHRVAVLQGVDPHPRLVWGETGRQTGRQTGRGGDRQVDRQVDTQGEVRQTGRQTGRRGDRQVDRQVDTQVDRQVDGGTDR